MKTAEEREKRKQVNAGAEGPRARTRGRRPNAGYVCVYPKDRPLILDYVNGFNRGDKETVATHLQLCLHCREMVETVLRLDQKLRPLQDASLHGEESDEVEADHARTGEVEAAPFAGGGE